MQTELDAAPVVVEYEPMGQFPQDELADEETNVPEGQLTQEEAPGIAWYIPTLQLAQLMELTEAE